ncbi:MAG: hypothetical protein ACRD1V_17905 [Vicinamibacterales bacterium]
MQELLTALFRLSMRRPKPEHPIAPELHPFDAYCEGWCAAMLRALQVADLVLRQRALYMRERRAAAAKRRAAARSAVDAAGVREGEELGAMGDHVGERVAERGNRVEWHYEAVRAVGFIDERQRESSMVAVHDDCPPIAGDEADEIRHESTVHPEISPAQLAIDPRSSTSPYPEGFDVCDGNPCGVLGRRTGPREPRSRPEKHAPKPATGPRDV